MKYIQIIIKRENTEKSIKYKRDINVKLWGAKKNKSYMHERAREREREIDYI